MRISLKHKEHKDHKENQLILLGVLCVLCVEICSAHAQDSSGIKVFERQVRVIMGSRETQEECREFAKVEARRAVLDQVGVYIEGRSDLMQRVRESSAGLTDTTDLQKRVLAIAAGVTQLEVAGEEWKSEGGALVLYLTCRVTVHPDDVAQRLGELVKDRQKVEDYERVQTEVARLREELTRLRADLDSAKSEAQISAGRESVKGAINELTAKDWYEKGMTANEPNDKIACFSLAIQLNPYYTDAYNYRGNAYSVKGNYDRAIAEYNSALQIDSNYVKSHNNRGAAYFGKGDYDRAIADYDRAIQIDSNLAIAYNNRGDAYVRKSEYDLAIADYDRAIQIDTNDARAYSRRSGAYMGKKDYDRAIADYSHGLQINPNDAQAYYGRGWAFKMKGDNDNARRDLQRAVDLGVWQARRDLEGLP